MLAYSKVLDLREWSSMLVFCTFKGFEARNHLSQIMIHCILSMVQKKAWVEGLNSFLFLLFGSAGLGWVVVKVANDWS